MQIGDSAGAAITLKAMTLRGAAITISGSGVMPSMEVLTKSLQELMDLACRNQIHVDVEVIPLADIEKAWARDDLHGRRLVIMP